jgi:predicted DNA-binding transcriptional regulator AlpA
MRILTLSQLQAKGMPWCRYHLFHKTNVGESPAPIRLSNHWLAWLESEVDESIAARTKERDSKIAA